MNITKTTYAGKTNLNEKNAVGSFEQFDIVINDRFDFSVYVQITDINRENLDVDLVIMSGENGFFEIKPDYLEEITDEIKSFVEENDDNWRQTASDWAEYFDELRDEY